MTDELLRVARLIEDMKQECGMDPESPAAIRNGRLMSIAAILRTIAASHSAPAGLPPLTDRQLKLIRFALQRLSRGARNNAECAAQDVGGRSFKEGAVEAFLRDANEAEALLALLSVETAGGIDAGPAPTEEQIDQQWRASQRATGSDGKWALSPAILHFARALLQAQSGDGSPGSESTRPDQPKLSESGGVSSIGLGAEGEQ